MSCIHKPDDDCFSLTTHWHAECVEAAIADWKDGSAAEADGHDKEMARSNRLHETILDIVELISSHGSMMSGDEVVGAINALPTLQKAWKARAAGNVWIS